MKYNKYYCTYTSNGQKVLGSAYLQRLDGRQSKENLIAEAKNKARILNNFKPSIEIDGANFYKKRNKNWTKLYSVNFKN